jgi:hypothetical protein
VYLKIWVHQPLVSFLNDSQSVANQLNHEYFAIQEVVTGLLLEGLQSARILRNGRFQIEAVLR